MADLAENFKVSAYPFKQYKKMLKNMKALLYTYFYNILLNVLNQPFAIYRIYLYHFLGKIRVKIGPNTNYFSYFLSSWTNRIAICNNLFAFICRQSKDKQNLARDFLLLIYFFENLLLFVFMQKYAFKTGRIIAVKNDWLIVMKTFLFSILLEMRMQSLKSIVEAVFVLKLVKCSPPRNRSLAKFL